MLFCVIIFFLIVFCLWHNQFIRILTLSQSAFTTAANCHDDCNLSYPATTIEFVTCLWYYAGASLNFLQGTEAYYNRLLFCKVHQMGLSRHSIVISLALDKKRLYICLNIIRPHLLVNSKQKVHGEYEQGDL